MALAVANPISTRLKKMLVAMGIPQHRVEINDFPWIMRNLDRTHALFSYVWPLLIREYNQRGN